jgi:hypothetical protein
MSFTACSWAIEFVVINESNQPIEVRSKVSYSPGDTNPFIGITPSIAKASSLRAGDREWRRLSEAEYRLDQVNRTVIVRVMPGDAFLIARFHDTSIRNGEPEYFAFEEIAISGAYGGIRLDGRQAVKAFSAESDRLYVLAYK